MHQNIKHQPSRPLQGFGTIPLYPADLAPFGAELGSSGRAIWAIHRNAAGEATGREMVYGGDGGRSGYGFTPGGRKGLFSSTPGSCRPRLVLVDGPIQAVARAALDGPEAVAGTTYAAPGGPWTKAAAAALAAAFFQNPPQLAVVAFAPWRDGSCPSEAACLAMLGAFPNVAVEVLLPAQGSWVEALREMRRIEQAA